MSTRLAGACSAVIALFGACAAGVPVASLGPFKATAAVAVT